MEQSSRCGRRSRRKSRPRRRGRPPPRGKNAERRPREFLTADEVDRLIATAKQRGRWGQRDAAAILLAFSHGLRVSELVALTWAQIDFRDGVIHVRRRKNGRNSTQPLRGAEVRVLKQLRREWPEGQFILQSERGGPISAAGFRDHAGAHRQGGRLPLAGPPASAAARYRLCAGQQGRRYKDIAALSRAPLDRAHGALYRTRSRSLHRVMAGLLSHGGTRCRNTRLILPHGRMNRPRGSARAVNALDWDNLAEEIEGMGKSQRREVFARLKLICQHLLKWQHQRSDRSRS